MEIPSLAIWFGTPSQIISQGIPDTTQIRMAVRRARCGAGRRGRRVDSTSHEGMSGFGDDSGRTWRPEAGKGWASNNKELMPMGTHIQLLSGHRTLSCRWRL